MMMKKWSFKGAMCNIEWNLKLKLLIAIVCFVHSWLSYKEKPGCVQRNCIIGTFLSIKNTIS